MTTSLELTSYQDITQPFLIHHSNIRGRMVRLSKSVDAIISQHSYPKPVSSLLAEMCVLAVMLSSNLKGRGKLTMQLRGDGDIEFIVVDVNADGAIRGYAELKEGAVFDGEYDDLQSLTGQGYLAITLQKGKTPYQGIVELGSGSLSESMQSYFTNSEQNVVFVKTAVGQHDVNGESIWCCGGIMIQHVPKEGGEQTDNPATKVVDEEDSAEVWSRNRMMTETIKDEEILDIHLSPQALLYRLYNEDGVWVYDAHDFRAECSCSRDKVKQTLAQFPQEELESMLEDDEHLEVKCQFCNGSERFTLEELQE